MKKIFLTILITFLSVSALLVGGVFTSRYVTAQGQSKHTCQFGEWTIVLESTCTKKGSEERFCACGNKETRDLDLINHEYKDISVVGNKCEGEIHTRKCVKCGDEEEFKFLGNGHIYPINPKKIPATCTEGAYYEMVCSECGEEFNLISEFEHALGHDYVEEVVAPTCTECGYTKHTCSRCGDTYNDNIVAVSGHEFNSEIKLEPGCTVAGCTTQTCSSCGLSYDLYIEPLGHDYVDEIVSPCCTTKGFTSHKCSRCTSSLPSTDFVDSLEHDYIYLDEPDYKNNIKAVCSRKGTSTCSFFGHSLVIADNYGGKDFTKNPGTSIATSYSSTSTTAATTSISELKTEVFANSPLVYYIYVTNFTTTIDINAFRNASGLKHLSLPKSFENTEFNFEGCPEDLIIYYHD